MKNPGSLIVLTVLSLISLTACSVNRQIAKEARADLVADQDLSNAQVGIVVYNPATDKFLYDYQGEKFFVPASNTKLLTCYAAMKYLGDSLPAAKVVVDGDEVFLEATGDPTFLHPDFKNQPLFDFLKQPSFKKIYISTSFASEPLGRGWAWDDYMDDYMAERDPFPIYANLATVELKGDTFKTVPATISKMIAGTATAGEKWDLYRKPGAHFFTVTPGKGTTDKKKTITMAMEKGAFAATFLADTLHKEVLPAETEDRTVQWKTFHSQPTDSLLKIMMHRSDNFFAEQSLMMVSKTLLGEMNDREIIDTLLKSDYKDLPQKPKWVDGSGLSRYNLISPRDFVWVLNKMDNDFGFTRISEILPTGGEGTLSSLYKNYQGKIFAKTGSLSNHLALSGFLITRKNQKLIFSVIINNHTTSPALLRKKIEKFLTSIIDHN